MCQEFSMAVGIEGQIKTENSDQLKEVSNLWNSFSKWEYMPKYNFFLKELIDNIKFLRLTSGKSGKSKDNVIWLDLIGWIGS